jgi:hypothetical protein
MFDVFQTSTTQLVLIICLYLPSRSCMATAMLLYYRLAQSAGQNIEEAEDELAIRRV